ncbi:unnamed protein product [Clonostachys solani]|uniref:Uncharacterized protein n=1 Tax=Clonostachys solani TaxID=160281 RepID=A0A9N9ZDP1_9HYPO|nr:unnamed protein product [Clonostachys solani]
MAAASSFKPGAGRSRKFDDQSLDDIILIDQLKSERWAEGLAIRPNGHALATMLEHSELYLVDLNFSTAIAYEENGPAAPKLIQTFPDCNATYNIRPLIGTEDEAYAVLTGHSDTSRGKFEKIRLWHLSFGPNGTDTAPTISKIADLPDALFGFGMAILTEDAIAVVDPVKHCVWRVRISTGEVSMLLHDPPSMAPSSKDEAFGVNRLQVAAGYLWYGNFSTGVLSRAPFEYTEDGRDVRVTGPAKPVAEGCIHCDGIAVRNDGAACYVVSFTEGCLWRVDVDSETGKGSPIVMFEDLISPTVIELMYYPFDEKPTLYIVCCGAWNPEDLEGERGRYLTLANVDKSKMQIHVTVEMTISYEDA